MVGFFFNFGGNVCAKTNLTRTKKYFKQCVSDTILKSNNKFKLSPIEVSIVDKIPFTQRFVCAGNSAIRRGTYLRVCYTLSLVRYRIENCITTSL